jgi:7,8-dihydroneopterin aldolase/epimerase/oxygenase
MSDRIFISGIECYGFHGVTGAERKVGNRFRIDVGLRAETSAAAASDKIADTVDYREIHRTVAEWVERRRFRLLEAMADGMARELLERFPAVEEVELTIRKLGPRLPGLVADVGIEVRRRREDLGPRT